MTDWNAPDSVFHDTCSLSDDHDSLVIDASFLHLGSEASLFHLADIELPELHLRRFNSEPGLLQYFQVEDGWTTFSLSLDLKTGTVWNGYRSPLNGLGIVRSNLDHEVISPPGYQCIEIDVADRLLAAEGLDTSRLFVDSSDFKKCAIAVTPAKAGPAFQRCLAVLEEQCGTGNKETSAVHKLQLRRIILDELWRMFEATELNQESLPTPDRLESSYTLVRRARGFFHDSLKGLAFIEDVAAELNVTSRTLQLSFQHVLGISPKQYYLSIKLDEGLRRLKHHDNRGAVGEIALELGFSSSSRFSEHFKRRYGASPSQYLNR